MEDDEFEGQELDDMHEFCKKHNIKVNELKREKLNFIF